MSEQFPSLGGLSIGSSGILGIFESFIIFRNHLEFYESCRIKIFRQQDNSTGEWTSDYDSVDLCMDIFGYTFFMSLAFAFIPQGIISYFAYTSRNNQLGKS